MTCVRRTRATSRLTTVRHAESPGSVTALGCLADEVGRFALPLLGRQSQCLGLGTLALDRHATVGASRRVTPSRRSGAVPGDVDQVGYIDASTRAIFGRSYAAEPEVLVDQLAKDEAIATADTILLTVPNQLGVEYNAHLIETVLRDVAPGLGWR